MPRGPVSTDGDIAMDRLDQVPTASDSLLEPGDDEHNEETTSSLSSCYQGRLNRGHHIWGLCMGVGSHFTIAASRSAK